MESIDQGIVLKTINVKEVDKIAFVFFLNHGLLSLYCPGTQKIGSKNNFGINSPVVSQFEFFKSNHLNKLSKLKRVAIIQDFINTKQNLYKMNYVYAILDNCEKLLTIEIDKKSLYGFLLNSLTVIESGVNPDLVYVKFLLLIFALVGQKLQLSNCVECSSRKQILLFNIGKGGLICCDCNEEKKIIFNKKFLIALIKIENTSLDDLAMLNISEYNKELIINILYEYAKETIIINNKILSFVKIIKE